MAKEIKEPKEEAPVAAKTKSALSGKWVKIVGLGLKGLKKGKTFEVHSSTANNLIDKGLVELAPKK